MVSVVTYGGGAHNVFFLNEAADGTQLASRLGAMSFQGGTSDAADAFKYAYTADLVLLVDSSSSVGREDFEHLEDFIKDLVVQLPVGQDQVQVGLVQFSGHPSLEFPLNMYSDRLSVLKAVDTLQFMGGGTNTGDAIDYVTSNVYTADGGARTDVPRVAVVITDGQSVDPAATAEAANRARSENIGLVAVGVGSHINEQELQAIANDPDSAFVFKVDNYKDLKAQTGDILKSVCTDGKCMYKGMEYMQSEQWEDGCDYRCVCENARVGQYRCYNNLLPSTQGFQWVNVAIMKLHAQQHVLEFPTSYYGYSWTKWCPKYENVPDGCGTKPDPSDPCCMMPDCPASISYIALPVYGKGLQSIDYCEYDGRHYRHGETWEVGCDYNCVCEDAYTGTWRCVDKCEKYVDIPAPYCHLERDPNNLCCQRPVCNFLAYHEAFCVYNEAKFYQGQTWQDGCDKNCRYMCVYKAQYYGQGQTWYDGCDYSCTCVCVYNGVPFNTGEVWEDGCDLRCVCEDGATNDYRCDQRCLRYLNVPAGCQMVVDPKGLLLQDPILCTQSPANITVPNVTPPPPGATTETPGPNGYPTPGPGETPTPTVYVNPPGRITGVAPTPTTRPGYPTPYTQKLGETWDVGCDQVCTCDDSSINYYTCADRCPSYSGLPPGCTMVASVSDPCCLVPQCYESPMITPPPGMTLAPGATPPPIPVGIPGIIVGNPNNNPSQHVCVYNGRTYTTGQRWYSGCEKICVCEDGKTGFYRCSDRCLRYPQAIASFCSMARDPMDPCCMVPDCYATPAPGSTVSPEFCVYKGIPYSHGQTWNDGCDLTCRCEDVVTGQVNCDDRCPVYSQIPPSCQLITDPNDPCCQVAVCEPTRPGFSNTSVILTGLVGNISGHSLPPNNRGPLTRTNECIYHGRSYQQGDVWDDGCSFTCQCVDSQSGQYLCNEKCPRIPSLPPTCQMIPDPSSQCCLQPYCEPWPTLAPTAQPAGTPPAPTGTGPTSSSGPTLEPTAQPPFPTEVCVYNNQAYRQDQVWYDGCDFMCRCEDASAGFYRCQERCARYDNVPSNCVMAPDPSDPSCCEIPECPLSTPTPAPGASPTPGIIPGPSVSPGTVIGVGRVPTPAPALVPPTGPDGSTLEPPRVTGPDGSPVTPTPAPGCYYKGRIYQVSDGPWEDACDYVCECLDDSTGRYQCSEKCPVLAQFPEDRCVLVQDPMDQCCMKPFCDFINSTPFPNGTPTPHPMLVPSDVCVYKGVAYRENEFWEDGCDYVCNCVDGLRGKYQCMDSALSCNVPNVGAYKPVPQIDSGPKPTQIPGPDGLWPTAAPQVNPQLVYGFGFTANGTSLPGGGAAVPAGYRNNTGGLRDKCVFDMKMYNQGEKWVDNCTECECQDSFTGFYRCNARCPTYNRTSLPDGCTVKTDPADICCEELSCPDKQGQTVTNITQILQLYPIVGTFSGGISGFRPGYTPPQGNYDIVSGQRNGCVYKGVIHPSGSTWEDGCDFNCECLDGVTGLYECKAKCITYSLLPPMCKMVSVEGECCPIVDCHLETTPAPEECRDKIDNCDEYGHGEQCRGAYLGWAQEHCPMYCKFCIPTHTAAPEPCEDVLPNCADYGTDVCTQPEYEKWAHDNCRHFCDLCATSPPPTTTVWTTPASGCFDGISYCSDYGRQVCDDNSYKAWVNQNCKKFCGVCGDQSTLSTATSAGTTTPAECADKITNCAAYPESSCGGQYLYWARDNCKKTCGYCDEQTTGAGGTATTAPPTCVDTINNCAAYGTQYCGGDYLAWAADNCAAFCRLCDDFELTTARAVTAQPGWVVLMKGVKGVPGDLWKLWSGTNTSNENVPQAQYLTNQYPGNYKSPYANSWGTCRFEQVKVAIYSGGQEKANIIFDVRSASKNDWFRPDNVVSSTWNVLPQTSDQFGTASDPHGHQFAVGDFHGCSGTGFLLVSTEDNSCPYEDTGSPNRPVFVAL
nr:hypothetical protein BaRGS_019101 [Batillaria attramentaria]